MRNSQCTIIVFLLSLFLMVACEKEKVVVQGGSFKHFDVSYPIKKVKVEHVGYEGEDYILRFLAYPATYTVSEVSELGYGAVIDAQFLSETKDFQVGQSYQLHSNESYLTLFPEIAKGDTTHHDTIYHHIVGGELQVDTADGFRTFHFGFLTAEGDSIEGHYLGDYVYNYRLNQHAYGELQFDTISCQLAMPTMFKWDTLFSNSRNYYELVFYSTDSRFTDIGKMKSGVQFVVGIHDIQQEWPAEGDYVVSNDPENAMSIYYGHKLKNTSWGTYWQVFYNSSPIGKANVVEGIATILSIDNSTLNITFSFLDQLGNEVTGSYNGPYLVTSH